MNIPKELIDQWLTEGIDSDMVAHEYIAYRAAEWALSQPVSNETVCARCGGLVSDPVFVQEPVSMEPVAMMRYDNKHLVLVDDLKKYGAPHRFNQPLYTAAQLAAARLQGAEDQTDKTLEAVRVASERIAELEKSNAVLLKCLEELSAYIAYNGDDWVRHKALAAIAEVKP